jgi:uracil-DNA glycosylase
MEIIEIIEKAKEIRDELKVNKDFKNNQISKDLPVIKPFIGSDIIKLIIIGQDPTVKNEKSREKITVTLNLDKQNSLRKYIEFVCKKLGLEIDNVYATNIFKYFYTYPPATTMDILFAHLLPNLELLKEELQSYKDCIIITLGEPVLQLLIEDKAKVREFWNYNSKTKITDGKFKICEAKDNKINRDFYPFPHQPSMIKEFYKNTIEEYIEFVKESKKK